jgi:hypothetical protein
MMTRQKSEPSGSSNKKKEHKKTTIILCAVFFLFASFIIRPYSRNPHHFTGAAFSWSSAAASCKTLVSQFNRLFYVSVTLLQFEYLHHTAANPI